MSRKLNRFPEGTRLLYEYDFGDTTQLLVTFMGVTRSKPQRELVRLLARNSPIEWVCVECGKSAELFFMDRLYDDENPLLCRDCAEGRGLDSSVSLVIPENILIKIA